MMLFCLYFALVDFKSSLLWRKFILVISTKIFESDTRLFLRAFKIKCKYVSLSYLFPETDFNEDTKQDKTLNII